ncbi:MAG: LptF/LptG family permease [Victivallaceae bacterium]|nr:LptF/LptG family permease [Victivallaceae bacterium]
MTNGKFNFWKRTGLSKAELARLNTVPRRWGFLPTIDWYVLREFLIKTCILIFVFIVLFTLGNVFDKLDDFFERNASWSTIMQYLLLRLPGNIRFVLPITTLLGCIWTMATFGKNLEITAMRASGVSLFRSAGSILLMGVVITAGNIYLNELLVPYTEREAQAIYEVAAEGKTSVQHLLTYRSSDLKRTWLFLSFDINHANENVMVKSFRADGTLDWDIFARRATMKEDDRWHFENVIRTRYSRDGLMPKAPERIRDLQFDRTEMQETPQDILNTIKDEEELPSWVIFELLQRNEKIAPKLKAIYWTVFYYRLSFPWACLFAVFLGVPLATRNERSGIMLAIVSAVAVIIGYIVLSEIFLVLGKQGMIPPAVAGLTPMTAFLIYGGYRIFYRRT